MSGKEFLYLGDAARKLTSEHLPEQGRLEVECLQLEMNIENNDLYSLYYPKTIVYETP